MSKNDEYYSKTGFLSNSALTWYSMGPKFYVKQINKTQEEEDQETDPGFIVMGNAVHCAILEPDKFKDEYIVAECNRPINSHQENFAKLVHNGVDRVEAFRQCYSTKNKSDSVVEKDSIALESALHEYIKIYDDLQKRTILSSSQYRSIEEMKLAMMFHKAGNKWFFSDDIIKKEDSEAIILTEEPIFFNIKIGDKEIPCKAKPDKIVIYPSKKLIVDIELKTDRGPLKNFGEKFVKYEYHRQLAMYAIAMQNKFKELFPTEDISKWDIQFKTPVVTTGETKEVKVFDINPNLVLLGSNILLDLLNRFIISKEKGFDYDVENYMDINGECQLS